MSLTAPDPGAFRSGHLVTSDNNAEDADGPLDEESSIRIHGTLTLAVYSKQSIARPTGSDKGAAALQNAVNFSGSSVPAKKFTVDDSDKGVSAEVYARKTDLSVYLPAFNAPVVKVLMNSQFESLAWQENNYPVFDERHVKFYATAENLEKTNPPLYKELFEGPDGFIARAKAAGHILVKENPAQVRSPAQPVPELVPLEVVAPPEVERTDATHTIQGRDVTVRPKSHACSYLAAGIVGVAGLVQLGLGILNPNAEHDSSSWATPEFQWGSGIALLASAAGIALATRYCNK